jgi:hypothetical protein
MARTLRWILLILLPAAAAVGHDLGGPLHTQNAFLPTLFFIEPSPASAVLPPAGSRRLSLSTSYGNTCLYGIANRNGTERKIAEIDSESVHTELGLHWVLPGGTGLGARVLHVAHYGGVLDGPINWYHRSLGIHGGSRSRAPTGVIGLAVPPPEDGSFSTESPFSGLQSFVLDIDVPLIRGGDSGISLTVEQSTKVPLVGTGFRRTGVDWLARILAHRWIGTVSVDGSLGIAFLSRPDIVEASEFNPWIVPFGLSFEWTRGRTIHPTVTIEGITSPYSFGWPRTDRFSARISFGTSIFLSSRFVAQISLSEEFLTFAATDVALNASLTWLH